MIPIRVIVADDHPLMRAGLRTELAAEEDIALVGEATDGYEARRLCQALNADVLLLDLSMPGPPATETIAYLHEQHPELKVVILSAYDDEAFLRSLVPRVAGYVLKDETTDALVRAIRAVMQGDKWFSRRVVDQLAQMEANQTGLTEEIALTTRELEVLRLVAEGSSNTEIAQALSISKPTVRFHLRNIYSKTGLRSRTELAVWAVRGGP